MICTCLSEPVFENCLRLVRQYDFVEIRLDGAYFTLEQVQQLFQSGKRTIATFRPGKHGDNERAAGLKAAIQAGATMVDIEVDAPSAYREDILSVARKNGSELIVSFHDYQLTPLKARLLQILDECYRAGADIAKIACQVNSREDALRLLSLFEQEGRKLITGMGEQGKIVRLAGLYLGSAFGYAAPDQGSATASGQFTFSTLSDIIQKINQTQP